MLCGWKYGRPAARMHHEILCGSARRCSSALFPIPPLQTGESPDHDSRCRKQRIVITPQLLFPQIAHPFRYNLPDLFAHGEEERGEGLAEFCLHFSRILVDAVFYQVDMLQLHGSNGAVPCAGQQRESHQSAVTALDLGLRSASSELHASPAPASALSVRAAPWQCAHLSPTG
jgi:hypothetical protein